MTKAGQLNAEKLRGIKEGLASRNEVEILESLHQIMGFDDDESLDKIIRSDVPVLLAEAIQPAFTKSNGAVYECLGALCCLRRFYADGHALTVSQACCRSAMFLVAERNEAAQLHHVLRLLTQIMAGYEIFSLAPDRRLLLQVNDFLTALTTKTSENVDTRYLTAVLMVSFTELKSLRLREGELAALLASALRSFDMMISLAEVLSLDPLMDKIVAVTCDLAVQLSRFLSGVDGMAKVDETFKAAGLKRVSEFVVKVALPHVMSVPLVHLEENPARVTSLFHCVASLLDSSQAHEQALVNDLTSGRILSLIPTVLAFSEAWQNDTLLKITRQLLYHLLTSLAHEVFEFPAMWPEGEDHFRHEMESGVLATPANPTLWLQTLSDPLQHRSAKLAILLFLYFHVLVEGSLSDEDTHLAVVRLMMDLNSQTARGIFTKTIWLILALCHVSGSNSSPEVILKLSTLLEGNADLDHLYTHHPTLLFYAFSGDFPCGLQGDVLRLWLLRDEEGGLLMELLEKSQQARFAVVNLIQNGSEDVVEKAASAFKHLLVDGDRVEDASVVWHLLPTVLTQACANSISVTNLEKMIELVLVRLPPDGEDQSRAAALLPAAVAALHAPPLALWQLAHHLLIVQLQAGHLEVVTCYMQSQEFMRKLLTSLSSDCSTTVDFCLRICAWLSKVQREGSVPQVDAVIELDVSKILQHLHSPVPTTRNSAILFFREVLDSLWSPRICSLGRNQPTSDVLRHAFFLLINNTFQDQSDECWLCLTSFLKLFPSDEPFQLNFLHSHWFLHLIETSLPKLHNSSAMLDLIDTWYSLRRPQCISSRRRCLSPRLDGVTVAYLTKELVSNMQPKFVPLLRKIFDYKEILDPQLLKKLQTAIDPRINRSPVVPVKPIAVYKNKVNLPSVNYDTITLDSEPYLPSQKTQQQTANFNSLVGNLKNNAPVINHATISLGGESSVQSRRAQPQSTNFNFFDGNLEPGFDFLEDTQTTRDVRHDGSAQIKISDTQVVDIPEYDFSDVSRKYSNAYVKNKCAEIKESDTQVVGEGDPVFQFNGPNHTCPVMQNKHSDTQMLGNPEFDLNGPNTTFNNGSVMQIKQSDTQMGNPVFDFDVPTQNAKQNHMARHHDGGLQMNQNNTQMIVGNPVFGFSGPTQNANYDHVARQQGGRHVMQMTQSDTQMRVDNPVHRFNGPSQPPDQLNMSRNDNGIFGQDFSASQMTSMNIEVHKSTPQNTGEKLVKKSTQNSTGTVIKKKVTFTEENDTFKNNSNLLPKKKRAAPRRKTSVLIPKNIPKSQAPVQVYDMPQEQSYAQKEGETQISGLESQYFSDACHSQIPSLFSEGPNPPSNLELSIWATSKGLTSTAQLVENFETPVVGNLSLAETIQKTQPKGHFTTTKLSSHVEKNYGTYGISQKTAEDYHLMEKLVHGHETVEMVKSQYSNDFRQPEKTVMRPKTQKKYEVCQSHDVFTTLMLPSYSSNSEKNYRTKPTEDNVETPVVLNQSLKDFGLAENIQKHQPQSAFTTLKTPSSNAEKNYGTDGKNQKPSEDNHLSGKLNDGHGNSQIVNNIAAPVLQNQRSSSHSTDEKTGTRPKTQKIKESFTKLKTLREIEKHQSEDNNYLVKKLMEGPETCRIDSLPSVKKQISKNISTGNGPQQSTQKSLNTNCQKDTKINDDDGWYDCSVEGKQSSVRTACENLSQVFKMIYQAEDIQRIENIFEPKNVSPFLKSTGPDLFVTAPAALRNSSEDLFAESAENVSTISSLGVEPLCSDLFGDYFSQKI